MAVIKVTKGMTTVNGTSGNDEINLKESVGNGIVINANGGNDIINVTRGDNHTINAGAGADFVTVATGKNYKINLGEGNDRVDLLGAEGHQVTAVAGTNNINVNNGSGYVITGGTGIDRLTIKGTNSNIKADLGAGEDVLGMATGSGNEIHGGADKDYFIVSGGENSTFYGDAGNDTLRLYRGEGHTLYAGAGDDSMLVTEANNSKVYGVSGKNQIMFFGGTGNEYHGGDEKDNITLKNKAEAVKVYGGTKNTVVNIQVGDKHDIDLSQSTNTVTQIMAGAWSKLTGGQGKDTLRIWGTTQRFYANLGAGNDVLNVRDGSYMTLETGAGKDDLQISGGNNNLYDAGADADTIYVTGGKENHVKAGKGDDRITIGLGVVGGKYLGGEGADTIKVSGSNLQVYGDHDSWMDYEMDALSAVYDDNITLDNFTANCTVDAGKGKDTIKVGGKLCVVRGGAGDDIITMDTTSANEVYGDDGNDTINVDKTYFYQSKSYTKNGYAKISGGAGNDVINVTADYSKYDAGNALVVFGGSGNDTIKLDCQNVIAYGGKGNDTFINTTGDRYYGNNMMGGAGDDTYIFDLEHGTKKDDTTFRIDNRTYRESTDRDELRIENYEGSIDTITLKKLGDDKYETRRLELKDPEGRIVCLTIDGFQALNRIRIHYKGSNKFTDYGTGVQFEKLLSEKGRVVLSGIETQINWANVYNNEYSSSMEAAFGTFEDFIARDLDLKITGNAF